MVFSEENGGDKVLSDNDQSCGGEREGEYDGECEGGFVGECEGECEGEGEGEERQWLIKYSEE